MLPIRDNNPAPRFPFIMILIVFLNVAVFILQLKTQLKYGEHIAENVILRNALIPARDFAAWGLVPFTVWARPFVAHMFMHGGFFHIFFNLWSLWIFGANIEGALGHFRFLFFYLACGLAAALTHCYFNPHSAIPVVGASGAIAGVMGAYLLLFPRAKLRMFTLLVFWPLFFELPAVVFLLIWFLGQLASEAALQSSQAAGEVGGIAFSAHIGGFIAGMILLPFFKRGAKSAAKGRARSQ